MGGDKDKIKDELELVLAKFLDLEEFEKFLPSQAVESEERDRDMAAEQAVVQQDGNDENSVTNPCDDFAGSLTAPAKSLFKLLHDFLSAELETEFQQIFLQADDAKKALQTTLVPTETNDKWGVAVGQFIQDMELLQASVEEASAGDRATQAPAPKIRELVKTASDDAADFENAVTKKGRAGPALVELRDPPLKVHPPHRLQGQDE